MSLYRIFKDYKEELDLACVQNSGVESELYSIIATIIRESEQGANISLRDVTVRRETINSKRLKGESGFPDFVVLSREKIHEAKIYGCIEAKAFFEELDANKYKTQLEGHIKTYNKVIYTDGLTWRLYDKDIDKPVWEVVLGQYKDGEIDWYKHDKWFDLLNRLDNIKWIEVESDSKC